MDKLLAKIETLKTPMIKEMLISLVSNFQEEADVVVKALLAELEKRMPADEYVAFCDSL